MAAAQAIKKVYGKELHPPGYNFMGPGTSIEDRISLNYKREGQGIFGFRKGTNSFFIPASKSDYTSFIHDLLYWAPDNAVKAFADAKFLNEISSTMGMIGIGAQFARRGAIEGVKTILPSYMVAKSLKKSLTKEINKLLNIYTKTLKSMAQDKRLYDIAESKELVHMNTINQAIQEVTGVPFAEFSRADFEAVRSGASRYRNIDLIWTLFKNIPPLITLGYISSQTIIPKMRYLKKTFDNYMRLSDEYKEMVDIIDDVMEKYDAYLNEVGSYPELKDVPLRDKIFHIGPYYDIPFYLKKTNDITKSKAKEKYVEFFKAFEKYTNYMNKKYDGVPDYVPFKLEPLNMDKLELVAAPSAISKENINDMVLFNKTINSLIFKPEPVVDLEVLKVLRGEQPAPETSYRIDPEILKVLTDEQPAPETSYRTDPETGYRIDPENEIIVEIDPDYWESIV